MKAMNTNIHFWVAKELANVGMGHFGEEDALDSTKLFKVQWKEGVQIPGQISDLPEDFYPKLRTLHLSAKEETPNNPKKSVNTKKQNT